jgi:hypothetical protein
MIPFVTHFGPDRSSLDLNPLSLVIGFRRKKLNRGFMKKMIWLAVLLSSSTAFATECYQLSTQKDIWSKTPELLCVDSDIQKNEFTLTLKSGLPFAQKTVATFNLNLLARVKCMDCNQDLFGLSDPSNSTFNALSIQFDGARDLSTMKEEGTVSIGAMRFYYRSF